MGGGYHKAPFAAGAEGDDGVVAQRHIVFPAGCEYPAVAQGERLKALGGKAAGQLAGCVEGAGRGVKKAGEARAELLVVHKQPPTISLRLKARQPAASFFCLKAEAVRMGEQMA